MTAAQTVRVIRKRADESYKAGIRAQQEAEQARADYYRLRAENRERYAVRGKEQWVADAAFSGYQVTKDCIDTEQMCSRWATERLTAARTDYQQVNRLMDEMTNFLSVRWRRRVPRPRVGD